MGMAMERERFEQLVAEALEGLPLEFQRKLENIAVVVEDWPSEEQLSSVGLSHPSELLGLYEGVPLTEGGWHRAALPDKITIFQRPIERICRSDREIRRRVGETVRHEIAHYFGISDERLREIERRKRR
jgi:predicted Zn-dependent protease with MMP-like domain